MSVMKQKSGLSAIPKFILCLALLVGISAWQQTEACAAPANPFPQQVTQADGTEITIAGRGDEFFLWAEDENGYVIAHDSENWRYAYISGGKILPGPEIVGAFQPYVMTNRITSEDLLPLLARVDRTPSYIEADIQPTRAWQRGAGITGASAAAVNMRPNMLVMLVEYNDMPTLMGLDYWYGHHFATDGKTVNNYFHEVSGGRFQFRPVPFAEPPCQTVTENLPDGVLELELRDDGAARVKLDRAHPGIRSGDEETRAVFREDAFLAFDTVKAYIDFSEDAFPESSLHGSYVKSGDFHVSIIVAGWEESNVANTQPEKVHAYARMIYLSGGSVSMGVDLRERDNPRLLGYVFQGEIYSGGFDESAVPGRVGITVHELGHSLGLPDLYDLTFMSEGTGPYSLMSYGMWGAANREEEPGSTPVHLDAWSKIALGFVAPSEINADQYWKGGVNRMDTGDYNVLKLTSPADPGQYFLVENRGLYGYDAGLWRFGILPRFNNHGGIMIYHIDESVTGTRGRLHNNNRDHEGVGVEPADGSNILYIRPAHNDDDYIFCNHFFSNDEFTVLDDEFADEYNIYGGRSGTFNLFDGTTTPDSNFYDGSGLPGGQTIASGVQLKINSSRGAVMEIEVGTKKSVPPAPGPSIPPPTTPTDPTSPASPNNTVTVDQRSYFVVGYDPVSLWINVFSDVAAGAWYYDAVAYVNYYGLFNGDGQGSFMPQGKMTRAMFVTVLWNLENRPNPNGFGQFSDVAAGTWHHDAVQWASENGLISGIGGGRYAPDSSITRQEMAVMLMNYANFKGYEIPNYRELPAFMDYHQIDFWAKTAARELAEAGVLSGNNNEFKPKDEATRAEVAQMFMNFLRAVAGESTTRN